MLHAKIARPAAVISTGMIAVCLVAGCSSADDFDGVLWRQLDAVKQPVFAAFEETRGMDRTALLDDIVSEDGIFPGHYHDGLDGPEISEQSGGVFLSRLAEGADWASLNVLLFSGHRDPAGDALAEAEAYGGPPSVYTCFQAVVEFTDNRVADWVWDSEAECDPGIVAALEERAQFAPLERFAG